MNSPAHKQARYPLIAQAAGLLLKCAGYLDDHDAASCSDDTHVETFYAIDTDVIKLYLDPENNKKYADVFGEGDEAETALSLAFLLGDFLLQSEDALLPGKPKSCRFLLIPPHDDGLFRMLSAIHRDLVAASKNVDVAAFDNLSRLFENYGRDKDQEKLLQGLQAHVPDLVELFNPYRGPRAELTRFGQLPDTTFQNIETYRDGNFTFPLLDPVNNAQDRKLADGLIEQWEGRLKPRNKKAFSIKTYAYKEDAEALALLEHVNAELRGKGKRVALITGSKNLFEAGDMHKPIPGDERTFSDLYLRHPQAFLAHAGFFRVDPQPNVEDTKITFNLIDWLNLFFPTGLRDAIQPQGKVHRLLLHRIENNSDPAYSKLIELVASSVITPGESVPELHEGWKAQVTSLAKARYAEGLCFAKERGAKELAEKLEKLRNRHDWSLENLREWVYQETVGSISELYLTTVWFGLWTEASREQPKGVPALRFDEPYKEIENYCREVVRLQLNPAEAVTQKQMGHLRELNRKVIGEDQSLYHAHVVHALAFATKGHWYATITLAKTALAICNRLEQNDMEVRRGREAAYLACIASRRMLKDRSGLNEASRYLAAAIRLENEGKEKDIRFSAEELAIQTRHHFFDYFCEQKKLDIEKVGETLAGFHDLIGNAENETNSYVKHWVLRQSLTNYFTLQLMLRDKTGQSSVAQNQLQQELEAFVSVLEDVSQHDHKLEDDPYAHLVCVIALAAWAQAQPKREEAKREAFASLARRSASHMPYDEERIKMLGRSIPALALRS